MGGSTSEATPTGGGLHAEQGAAADCLQRPLRSRFRQRLSLRVRLSEAGMTHACSGFKTSKGPR
jgi:hypothetical protein